VREGPVLSTACQGGSDRRIGDGTARKRRKFAPELKTEVVLEALAGESMLAEIAT